MHYEKFQDGTVKCIEDEIPFDVPAGWSWCRFGTYAINRDSERKPVSLSSRKDVEKIYDYYGASGKIDKIDNYLFDETLLLIGEDGANLVTRTKPIAFFATGTYWVNNHAHCIDAVDKDLLSFLCFYVNAIDLKMYVTGAAQPKLNQDNMNRIMVPIAPLNEQKKIVLAINAGFDNIDEVEKHIDNLQEGISLVKSKILDLAIRGKLVPQDPTDEPASILLERIRAEKEELIKQGKIKRDKNDSVIFKGEDNSYYLKFAKRQETIPEQLLFDLPHGWRWCTLYEIATIDLGKTLDKAKNTGELRPYLRSVNVRWNSIELSDVKKMKFEDKELERYSISNNDLLICEGGDVGRCCVWNEDYSIQYQNALHRVRLFQHCNPYYFIYSLMRYESQSQLKRMCAGVTIKHLTGDVLSKIPFALPPITEQKQIVEAIKKSFAYLDNISELLS